MKSGALQGIEVALWYALVEYGFYLISLVLKPHRVMLLQQWRGTAVLFGCYILLGVLAGVAASLTFRQPDRDGPVREALVFGAVVLFGVNAAMAYMTFANKVCVVGTVMLAAAALSSTFGRPALVQRPQSLFAALIFIAWIVCTPPIGTLSPFLRAPLSWAVTGVLIASAVGLDRLLRDWGSRHAWARPARFLKFAAILLLLFLPGIISSHAEEKQPVWASSEGSTSAPNVILITLDTVSARHMGIYGYSRANTPFLSELLHESTFYTRCIAASSLTLTSHASIFTGLYPQSHGAYKEFDRYRTGRPLSSNIPTLPQFLNTAGYRTMALVSNRYYLGDDFGTLRGFRFVDWFMPTVLVSSDRDFLLRNRIRSLLKFEPVPRDFESNTTPAEEMNSRAFYLLDEGQRDASPFLLFLNYMDAHTPYLPPAPYSRMYPGLDLGFDTQRYTEAMLRVNMENQPLDAGSRNHLVSQYDGGIAYLDEKVGELVAHLKATRQFDRTMIIITADHGESFGDRNILGHDTSVYEDQVHVPLIIKYPGQTHAERVETLVSHVDLMPTVLAVLGLRPSAETQGMDLRRIAGTADRAVVAEMHGSIGYDAPRFQQIEWALYSGSHKMIYSNHGMRELYDLAADPEERHNLYRQEDPRTAELRGKLTEWSLHTTPRYKDAAVADSETIKRLESLGYAHQGKN